jgi:hypothetical protein
MRQPRRPLPGVREPGPYARDQVREETRTHRQALQKAGHGFASSPHERLPPQPLFSRRLARKVLDASVASMIADLANRGLPALAPGKVLANEGLTLVAAERSREPGRCALAEKIENYQLFFPIFPLTVYYSRSRFSADTAMMTWPGHDSWAGLAMDNAEDTGSTGWCAFCCKQLQRILR